MKSLVWQLQRFIRWEREISDWERRPHFSSHMIAPPPFLLIPPILRLIHYLLSLDLVRVNVTQKSPSGLETKITSLGCFSWGLLSDIWSECLLSNLRGLRCSIGLFRSDYSWVLMEITMVIVFEILYGPVVQWRHSLRGAAHAGAGPFIKTALSVSSLKTWEPELQRNR